MQEYGFELHLAFLNIVVCFYVPGGANFFTPSCLPLPDIYETNHSLSLSIKSVSNPLVCYDTMLGGSYCYSTR